MARSLIRINSRVLSPNVTVVEVGTGSVGVGCLVTVARSEDGSLSVNVSREYRVNGKSTPPFIWPEVSLHDCPKQARRRSARFDRRFVGPSNAGLRAEIREAASLYACGPSRARAVSSLRGTVAMTASGTATLEDVVADYASGPDYVAECSCHACYARRRAFG